MVKMAEKIILHVPVIWMNQNDFVRWQLDEYVVLIILGQKIVVVLILWGCANYFCNYAFAYDERAVLSK